MYLELPWFLASWDAEHLTELQGDEIVAMKFEKRLQWDF